MFHGDGGGRRGKRSLAVGRRATFEKDRTGPLNAVHRRPAPGRTDCPVENTENEWKCTYIGGGGGTEDSGVLVG